MFNEFVLGVASTDNNINESKVIWKANLLDDEG